MLLLIPLLLSLLLSLLLLSISLLLLSFLLFFFLLLLLLSISLLSISLLLLLLISDAIICHIFSYLECSTHLLILCDMWNFVDLEVQVLLDRKKQPKECRNKIK